MLRRLLLPAALLIASVTTAMVAAGGASAPAVAAYASSPGYVTVLDEPLTAPPGTSEAFCHSAWRPGAAGVAARLVPTAAGLARVRVALDGAQGDWDVAVFDSTGRAVVASAEPDSQETSEGWTAEGGVLRVQACRRSGTASSVNVTVQRLPVDVDADAIRADPPQLVRVYTPTESHKDLVLALGFDLTEHGGRNTLGVVLHGEEDRLKLRNARLQYDVLVEDLVAQSVRQRRAEQRATISERALPSGRTDTYRTLADYNAEMKALADENPGLVKLFTMPNQTYLGKDIMGIEIAENVDANDGRSAFFNMGVHHAREWPSGEMPMEWAYELINGYKSGDPRATKVVKRSRNIVVPIVNADGFDASRSAGELAGAGGGRDESVSDTAYAVAGAAFGGEYRRKNCRLPDDSEAGECINSPGTRFENGVDPNRNYGGLWGGPGAETNFNGLTYRGPGPFSEPETRNIQSVVSRHQVMSLITNHTTAGLILRAPGVAALGDPVDENRGYKELGDAMGLETGYFSQKGFELYDTTGTTEDWSYNATGGFGFTFEIYCGAPNYTTGDCDDPAFHPTYARVIEEWEGTSPQADHVDDPGHSAENPFGMQAAYDGKGNREAYYLAAESAIAEARHSVIAGDAPAGATLRLTKEFKTPTWPQPQDDGSDPKPIEIDDKLETVYDVPASGKFEWHVNPSTRPFVAKAIAGPTGPPSPPVEFTGGASDDPRPCPGYYPLLDEIPQIGVDPTCWVDHPFEFPIGGGVDNTIATIGIEFLDGDDWDLEVYKDTDGDGVSEPEAGEPLVASSGNGATNQELAYELTTLDAPDVTSKYVIRIINYAAAGTYDGTVTFTGPPPAQEAKVEAWTLTCEMGGQVRQTKQVIIDRGERKEFDLTACATAGPGPTVTPTGTATGSPTASPTGSPTTSPTAIPTVGPGKGRLRLSVTKTPKRTRAAKNRKVRIRVACIAKGSPRATKCRGSVGLFAKIDKGKRRRIGRKALRLQRGSQRKVKVKLSRRSFRVVGRRGKLKVRVRARGHGSRSVKQIVVRPPRR